jgi:hypothetical protein
MDPFKDSTHQTDLQDAWRGEVWGWRGGEGAGATWWPGGVPGPSLPASPQSIHRPLSPHSPWTPTPPHPRRLPINGLGRTPCEIRPRYRPRRRRCGMPAVSDWVGDEGGAPRCLQAASPSTGANSCGGGLTSGLTSLRMSDDVSRPVRLRNCGAMVLFRKPQIGWCGMSGPSDELPLYNPGRRF